MLIRMTFRSDRNHKSAENCHVNDKHLDAYSIEISWGSTKVLSTMPATFCCGVLRPYPSQRSSIICENMTLTSLCKPSHRLRAAFPASTPTQQYISSLQQLWFTYSFQFLSTSLRKLVNSNMDFPMERSANCICLYQWVHEQLGEVSWTDVATARYFIEKSRRFRHHWGGLWTCIESMEHVW